MSDLRFDRIFRRYFYLYSGKLSAKKPRECTYCDYKLSSMDENFANNFLKTKGNNKCCMGLKCTCKELQKSISELER